MFDKARTKSNLEDAGFDEDDLGNLLEGLETSNDGATFRDFITHLSFTGDYSAVYDSDEPWYRAMACIYW